MPALFQAFWVASQVGQHAGSQRHGLVLSREQGIRHGPGLHVLVLQELALLGCGLVATGFACIWVSGYCIFVAGRLPPT